MLSLRIAFVSAISALLVLGACQRSADEAKVIGTWQCNPRNGKVWRYAFSSDHKAVLSLPHDESVDANLRDAQFDPVFSGTWRLDGTILFTQSKRKTRR